VRRLGVLLVAAALVMLLSPVQGASAAGGEAGDYISRINALRASAGRSPLQEDAQLDAIAQSWSAHMAAEGRLSHSPSLSSGITASWLKLGENVGTGPNNGAIWTAFVNSAHHYANIVDPAYNRVGVGVAYGNGNQWTTQRFMQVGGGSSGGGGGGGGGSSTPPAKASTPKAKATTPPATAPATTTTTAAPAPAPVTPPPPQPGPPPPADSARVAAVLTALRHLST
jgi:uncharacterized protein YkwD